MEQSTTNYKIIANEEQLAEFVDWLKDGYYYCCLLARKKYCNSPAVTYDKAALKRFTTTKAALVHKIRQLECAVGSYIGDKGLPIPQESLAIYITPTPRDLDRVFYKGISAFAKILEHGNTNKNPHKEILNLIQQTPKCGGLIDFDIDSSDISLIEDCQKLVAGNGKVIKTRGGFHFLIDKSKIDDTFDKMWYQKITKIADVTGDAMVPIVGCYQGGFIPHFL